VFSVVNSAVIVALPAFAAERRAAAPLLLGAQRSPLYYIDISCPHGAQQQTRPHAAAAIERCDRRTGGHPTVS